MRHIVLLGNVYNGAGVSKDTDMLASQFNLLLMGKPMEISMHELLGLMEGVFGYDNESLLVSDDGQVYRIGEKY